MVSIRSAIDPWGADRSVYTLCLAAPKQTLEWSDDGVAGAQRFIKRLWNLVQADFQAGQGTMMLHYVAKPMKLQKVTHDLGERLHFNRHCGCYGN